jgi:site-specific recombinase XerD
MNTDGEVLTAFSDYALNVQELVPRQVKAMEWEIRKLVRFLAGRGSNLRTVSLADVEVFVSERARSLSTGTLANVIGRVKALFRFLHLVGVREDDPGAWLRAPQIDRLTQVPPILSPRRLQQIFQTLGNRRDRMGLRDFALAMLLYTTAMRNREAGALRVGDIDWQKRTIRIREGKGDKERFVPLLWEAEQALQRYVASRGPLKSEDLVFMSRFGREMNASDVGEIFARWGQRLGWKLRPHQLRHIAASHLLAAGVPIETIQTLLGHDSVTTTMLYARLRPEELAESIRLHPLATGGVSLHSAKAGARGAEKAVEIELPRPEVASLRGYHPSAFAPVTTPFGQEVEAFLQSAATTARLRPVTVIGHRSGLRDLARFLEQAGVTELTVVRSKHLLAWIEDGSKRGLSPNTHVKRLQAVRALFQRAVVQGKIQKNPVVGLKVADQPAQERRVLTVAQMEALLAAPDANTKLGQDIRMALLLLYATGLRSAELRALQVGDLDLKAGWLRVREGKGGRVRDVPLPREVLPALRDWVGLRRDGLLLTGPNGKQIAGSTLQRWVGLTAAQAGIPFRVTPHNIRHTYSAHLLAAGVPVERVVQLMGHRTIRETGPYAHVGIDRVREAVNLLQLPKDFAAGGDSSGSGNRA